MVKYYIYKVTNKVNGRYYVGVHKTNNPNDHYMGSGSEIQEAIKQYGVSNFVKEVLFEFTSKLDAYKKEAELVTSELILTGNVYNKVPGGQGGWYGYLRKCKENPDLRKPVIEKIKAAIKSNKNGCKDRLLEALAKANAASVARWSSDQPPKGSMLGKKHTDETIRKMTGRIPWNKGKKQSAEHRAKIGKASKGRRSPMKGLSLSDEHRRKISEAGKRYRESLRIFGT